MKSPALPIGQRLLLLNAHYRARHMRLGRLTGNTPPFVLALLIVLALCFGDRTFLVPLPALELFAVATLLLSVGSWCLERGGARALTRADLQALPVEIDHGQLRVPAQTRYSPRVERIPLSQVGTPEVRRILADTAARRGWVRVRELWEAYGSSCLPLTPFWRAFAKPGVCDLPTSQEWADGLPDEWPRSHAQALAGQLENDLPVAASPLVSRRRL